jgi:hypothetical protein
MAVLSLASFSPASDFVLPAEREGGSVRGLVTGKYFNFNPLPPAIDVLGNPLAVPDLPPLKLPPESLGSRLNLLLAWLRLGRQSEETRLRWKVRDATSAVLMSVSPPGMAGAHGGGSRQMRKGQRRVPVRHPYHLRPCFDLLPQIPDSLGAERRYLEYILARTLKKYAEQMSLLKGGEFSFEKESREYFHAGYQGERHVNRITSQEERFNVLQGIYNNYFHGRNYYVYSLLRREKLKDDNRLLTFYARAAFFMARIDWNGGLMDKPTAHMMPTRDMILFYIRRDKTVLARYRSDPEFARQVKGILEAFPE